MSLVHLMPNRGYSRKWFSAICEAPANQSSASLPLHFYLSHSTAAIFCFRLEALQSLPRFQTQVASGSGESSDSDVEPHTAHCPITGFEARATMRFNELLQTAMKHPRPLDASLPRITHIFIYPLKVTKKSHLRFSSVVTFFPIISIFLCVCLYAQLVSHCSHCLSLTCKRRRRFSLSVST